MKVHFLILLAASASRLFYIALACLSARSFNEYDKSTRIITNESLNFLLRWDAIYFYEIVKNGYSREHLTAFFPAYPYLVLYITEISDLSFLCSGIITSNVLFVLTSLLIYKITLRRYGKEIAKSSVLFFMLNPASIIQSTLYSESLYNFLFIFGFYLLELNYKYLAVILFGISTITRSNGILNVLFFINYKRPIQSFIYIIQIILPLVLFQVHCYKILKLDKLQIPYQYIQKKYWDQGFLKFYNKVNIPNFIVGIPYVLFLIYCLVSFAYSKLKLKNLEKGKFKTNYFINPYNYNTVVLFMLLSIQCFMCLFFIHMQIVYRFVSYNLMVYWFMAFMYQKNGIVFRFICFAYIVYGIVYAVLFGSYFPPA